MKRTPTKYNKIDTLEELFDYQHQLKQNYVRIEDELKRNTFNYISGSFVGLAKRGFGFHSRYKDRTATAAKLSSELASKLAIKVVPKRWGWLEKWILRLLVITAVKKVIGQKAGLLLPRHLMTNPRSRTLI